MTPSHDKLDRIDSKLEDINIKLAVYNEQLKEHMRRSDALEEFVHTLKLSLEGVKTFQDKIIGGMKLITGSGALALFYKFLGDLL
jgi:hypothetical protein